MGNRKNMRIDFTKKRQLSSRRHNAPAVCYPHLLCFTLGAAVACWLLASVPFTANADDHGAAEKPAVVCIDPGHPSEVSAARTRQHGLTELDMNWQVAVLLAERLKARRYTVVMTKKSRDEFVTNRRRAEIANHAHALLLLRLHCDTGRGSGITFYAPTQPGRHGSDVGPSAQVIADSRAAAHAVHDGALPVLGRALHDNGVKSDCDTLIGGKQGALTGSIYSQVPAVTIEMVFLSNKADADFLRAEAGREKMADALAAGVAAWVEKSH